MSAKDKAYYLGLILGFLLTDVSVLLSRSTDGIGATIFICAFMWVFVSLGAFVVRNLK
jgi:hypothetical protein